MESIARNPEALRRVVEMEEQLLTLDDVRDRLRLKTKDAVLNAIRKGEIFLPLIKFGNRYYITRKAFRTCSDRQFKTPKRSRATIGP